MMWLGMIQRHVNDDRNRRFEIKVTLATLTAGGLLSLAMKRAVILSYVPRLERVGAWEPGAAAVSAFSRL
jgi:hypothetical protein